MLAILTLSVIDQLIWAKVFGCLGLPALSSGHALAPEQHQCVHGIKISPTSPFKDKFIRPHFSATVVVIFLSMSTFITEAWFTADLMRDMYTYILYGRIGRSKVCVWVMDRVGRCWRKKWWRRKRTQREVRCCPSSTLEFRLSGLSLCWRWDRRVCVCVCFSPLFHLCIISWHTLEQLSLWTLFLCLYLCVNALLTNVI